jgi:hypothetical protein
MSQALSDPQARRLRTVAAMTDAASILAVDELAKALSAQLNAPPTPAERHLGELGFLASLVQAEPLLNGEIPYVERKRYDELRAMVTPPATRSALLVERYGSWVAACRAASGLLPDGRNRGPAAPFPSWSGGRPKEKPYTKREVIAVILQCQKEYGRAVSSHEYLNWRHRRSTTLRTRGLRSRLPTQDAIYRVFGLQGKAKGRGRWRTIMEEVERLAASDESARHSEQGRAS